MCKLLFSNDNTKLQFSYLNFLFVLLQKKLYHVLRAPVSVYSFVESYNTFCVVSN